MLWPRARVLGPARPVIAREALAPGAERTRLALADLGVEAGLIGAGLLGLDELE